MRYGFLELDKMSLADEVAKMLFMVETPDISNHPLVKRCFQAGGLGPTTEKEEAELVQSLRTRIAYIKFDNEAVKREAAERGGK